MLWQLKNLLTGSPLSQAGDLPDNWGPIFGLHGYIDKIGDLSWLGPAYENMGWVQVEGELPPPPPEKTKEEIELDRVKTLLQESDWSMLPDVPMTVGEKENWLKYRAALRLVKHQQEFPENILWPQKPK